MIEEAIIKTLAYRDLFNYPLTAEELHHFLIGKKTTERSLRVALARLRKSGVVAEKDGFYFLPGREVVVSFRRQREEFSHLKMEKASRYARFLRLIPWVKAVFVTGAVAAGNASEESDIDILSITAPGRLWLGRFFVFLILTVLGVRRKANDPSGRDKICPNMFFTIDSLPLPKDEQNLYTAHEAVQARLIWERGPVDQLLLASNRWIGKFLPNVTLPRKPKGSQVQASSPLLDWIEALFYRLQLWYMRGRRTRQVVTPTRILFHAVDLPGIILGAYQQRLKDLLPKHLPAQAG